jgi:hypothetical protein
VLAHLERSILLDTRQITLGYKQNQSDKRHKKQKATSKEAAFSKE